MPTADKVNPPPPHYQHIDVVVYPGCNALIVVRNEIFCSQGAELFICEIFRALLD